MMFCVKCGSQSSIVGQRFCAHCGAAFVTPVAAQSLPPPLPRQTRKISVSVKILGAILALVGLGFVNIALQPETRHPPAQTRWQKDQSLRQMLDPPPDAPLTPVQHLQRGNTLLKQIDINNGDLKIAEALIRLVSEHGMAARKDPRTTAQANALMDKLAAQSLNVAKMQAWNSSTTQDNAQIECRIAIEAGLKAPSTASWSSGEAGRWRDHPGQFLISYTVDAQNSFGAKLRNVYQCQVTCLSENTCKVTKIDAVN